MEFLPSISVLLTFTAATMLLAITPGPDMTLAVGKAMREGKSAGLMVILGTNCGLVVHTLLVAFGVSALIVASPLAFAMLKTGGAAYLLFLTVNAIRKGSNFVMDSENRAERRPGALGKAFVNGLSVNLLNPKVIIFFMTFLPQFVVASDPYVTAKLIFFGVWFILTSLPITLGTTLAADQLSGWLKAHRRALRVIDYLFAGVFSAFAVKILMTRVH
ncbi:LysE family translocator [Martelella sp. HB161492]|uniref:LysE family translocator n=1 Tax=Martelella sp. HB161492 TaxID=2720726 RepID=UPI0015928EFD|nr:LysE family translocator [Martelella sp. HB161492]